LAAPNRLPALDGMRALAVLLVVAFHYTSSVFAAEMPRPSPWAGNLLVEHASDGVQLFFVISGYVIALTLGSCQGRSEFVLRRALRLLPAMVACSLMTMAIVHARFAPVRWFATSWTSLAPSWTFTPPELWSPLLGKVAYVDAAYWSLSVEICFYVWACLLFFSARQRFVQVLAGAAVGGTALACLAQALGLHGVLAVLRWVAIPDHAPLFAAGALFHGLYNAPAGGRWRHGALAATWLAWSVRRVQLDGATDGLVDGAFVAAFYGLFYAHAYAPALLKPLSWGPLVRIGAASYPLYLLHEYAGVSFIIVGARQGIPILAMAALVAAFWIAVSLCIHAAVERPVKQWATRALAARLRRDPMRAPADA